MIDLANLIWRFLAVQQPEGWIALVSWHLAAVLGVLGLLGGLGLHFLAGHLFGFYRRKGRLARWISIPSLLIILPSVQVVLAAYLVAVNAQELVWLNRTDPVVEKLGAHLLEPAFRNPLLFNAAEGGIQAGVLKNVLNTITEDVYREAIVAGIVPPLAAGSPEDPLGAGGAIMLQVGLRWLTGPHGTWLTPLDPAGGGEPAGEGERPRGEPDGGLFFLPTFMKGLIAQLPDNEALSRSQWEHIAGTRFVEGYLQPVMVEYLTYFAILAALLVLLADTVLFSLLRRIKRIGLPSPEKTDDTAVLALAGAAGEDTALTPAQPSPPGDQEESGAGGQNADSALPATPEGEAPRQLEKPAE